MFLEHRIFVGVDNPQQSKILQDKAFKTGYKWNNSYGEKYIHHNISGRTIILNPSGLLSWNNRYPDELRDDVVWTFEEAMEALNELIETNTGESIMKLPVYVDVKYPEVSSMLQNLGFKSGYNYIYCDKKEPQYIDCPIFGINEKGGMECYDKIGWKASSNKERFANLLSIEEMVEFLQTPKEKQDFHLYKPIQVNENYEAEFQKGESCVTFGCQKVNFTSIEKVMDRINKIKESR